MNAIELRISRLRERMTAQEADAFFSLDSATNAWLTGFFGSTSAVVVTRDAANLLCDFRYTEQAQQQVTAATLHEISGSLEQQLGAFLEASGARTAAFEPERLTLSHHQAAQAAFSGVLLPCSGLCGELRQVKDSRELACIAAASALAEEALERALLELRPGITEQEVTASLEYEFRRRGAQGASFDTIFLFGERSSLPHGVPGPRALQFGDIVLVDCGCRLEGYCSDLTRTFVFGRIPGDWFSTIYETTRAAQEAALAAVREGVSSRAVDAAARSLIVDAGFGDRFGHGTGHGLGLEVHEPPRLNMHTDTQLEAGMVVTIEPGIYLPGQGGVRIEDLVVVTKDGCVVLTRTPKTLRILEP